MRRLYPYIDWPSWLLLAAALWLAAGVWRLSSRPVVLAVPTRTIIKQTPKDKVPQIAADWRPR